MQRMGQVIRLRSEKRDAYFALHDQPWPGVLETLKAAHIHNYSIFVHADLLFAYFEYHGIDWDADQARIAADPETRAWWRLTDPCQMPLESARAGEHWAMMDTVFFLE
jgi:L-rhamnose mutarotase